MTSALAVAASALGVALPALQAWRRAGRRDADAAWAQLRAGAAHAVPAFDPAMVDTLPDAARRWFLFTIAPGTPLHTASEVEMHGQIGLGDRDAPRYLPMRAHQILAPPAGFVWKLDAAGGAMRISGSDATAGERSWTRFWWLATLPVVRAGGNADHWRPSFGRVVAEAAFWAPAALLPHHGVRRESSAIPDLARAVVTHGGVEQRVEIAVAADGRPLWVAIDRWSNANAQRRWRLQRFGGTLGGFSRFGGYTLPTVVDGGNHFGSDDYFAFFRARVDDIRFVAP